MPDLSQAQRISFGQYINNEVFSPAQAENHEQRCPYHKGREFLINFSEKIARYARLQKTIERSDGFLKIISSWKQSENFGLGSDFVKNLDSHIASPSRKFSLEDACTLIFREIKYNIESLFKNSSARLEHADDYLKTLMEDPSNIQGGMINALGTQLAWTVATIKKMLGESSTDIKATLENNRKVLMSMMQLQLGLFNGLLNELGARGALTTSFHKFEINKFELMKLRSAFILVPKAEVLQKTIDKAKDELQTAVNDSNYVKSSFSISALSGPLGCPAAKALLNFSNKTAEYKTKANLASEFMDYLDLLIEKIILPRLDKLN